MLESGDGLARTFQQAESIAKDSWNLLEPLAVEDIEQSHGIRRSASPSWLKKSSLTLIAAVTLDSKLHHPVYAIARRHRVERRRRTLSQQALSWLNMRCFRFHLPHVIFH
jgi:dsRNA-specific ribonuclease